MKVDSSTEVGRPGYYSVVILVPEHQIGIVTMATGHAVRAVEAALGLIRNADALPPVTEPTPNPALLDARSVVTHHTDSRSTASTR